MTTRRSFLQALAAPALASPPRLRLGIGTFTYHSLSIPAMTAELGRLSIAEIEMSRPEFMLMERPSDALARSARAALDAAGIRCVSLYTATIADSASLDRAVTLARLLGASHLSGDAPREFLAAID